MIKLLVNDQNIYRVYRVSYFNFHMVIKKI